MYWLKRKGIDFVVVGQPLIDDDVDKMRQYQCQYFDDNFMVIRANGRLTFCAYNEEMVNNPDNAAGHLSSKETLLEAYNSKTYKDAREAQRLGVYNKVCEKCGFAYTGLGFQGAIKFRKDPKRKVYFQQDYYNQFFSLKKKWKPTSYYKRV
jgi:hypothetical protein